MEPLRLVAVSAGLSDPSSTRLLAGRLVDAAQQRFSSDGRTADIHIVELRELVADIAQNLTQGYPSPALSEAISAVTRADGLIAVTPVFNGSYSGLFKSFFDLIEPASLAGTPVLIGATGGTARHSLALDHALRPLFAYLRAMVVPTAVFAATADWGTTGDSYTENLPVRISRAAHELVDLTTFRAARNGLSPAIDTGDGVPGASVVSPFADLLAALNHHS